MVRKIGKKQTWSVKISELADKKLAKINNERATALAKYFLLILAFYILIENTLFLFFCEK